MENNTFAKRIEEFDGTFVTGMYFGCNDPINQCCFLTALLTPEQRQTAYDDGFAESMLDYLAEQLEISPITAEEAVNIWDEWCPPDSAAGYMAELLDDDPNRRDLVDRLEERGFIHYL